MGTALVSQVEYFTQSLGCFPTPLFSFMTPAGAHPRGPPSPERPNPSSGGAWLCCALGTPSCPHTLCVHIPFASGCSWTTCVLLPSFPNAFPPSSYHAAQCLCAFYKLSHCNGQNSSPPQCCLGIQALHALSIISPASLPRGQEGTWESASFISCKWL